MLMFCEIQRNWEVKWTGHLLPMVEVEEKPVKVNLDVLETKQM